MRKLTIEDTYNAVTLIALLFSVDELLVNLNDTVLFKQQLKVNAKKLRTEIDKQMPLIQEIFELEPDAMEALYLRASEYVPKVFKLTPDKWQCVTLLTEIIMNPEDNRYKELMKVLNPEDL